MQYQERFQGNESISNEYSSCWKYHHKANTQFPLHCHSYYELSYITKGTRYEKYNREQYKVSERSLFFLTPLTVHGFQNITSVDDVILQFSPEFLHANATTVSAHTIISHNPDREPFFTVTPDSKIEHILHQLECLCNVVDMYSQPSQRKDLEKNVQKDLQTNILLLQLLSELLKDGFLIVQEEERNYSEMALFDKVINRLLSEPEHMPDMKDAANMVGISYYHFSRVFKKATGFNYMEYCNHLRIQQAEELLIQSNLTIGEIANQIGMETNSGFTRLFKKSHGISPLKYRHKYR